MPGSTSPTAAAAMPLMAGERIPVRRRPSTARFTARQLAAEHLFELGNGRTVRGIPSDWVIFDQDKVIDVCGPTAYLRLYEPIVDGELHFSGAERVRIEQTLGFGSTQTADVLTRKIEQLAGLSIGGIAIEFSTEQWVQLHARAKKRGIPTDALLRQLLDRFTQDLWNGGI